MKKNDVLWVDFIRVIAIFSVVWLHSTAPLLFQYKKLSALNWWAGNIYDSLVRMCVPLLFILSGYLLLGKQETIRVYFIKRINKILIPLMAWSIFYIFWKRYYLNVEVISFRSFYSLFVSPTYYHLWFLYALIGLYLYIPILRILIQNSPKEILYYFVALWFIAVSIIPFIERAAHITSSVDLNMISGYVGYLVIGQILGDVQINKRQFIQIFLVALICTTITMIGTFFLTVRHNGIFDSYFYDYLSPNVILFSISTFTLLKYLADKIIISENQKNLLNLFSSASFGIYLIHPMVMSVLKAGSLGFSWKVSLTNAVYGVPILAVLTFGISFVVILLLQQIPYIRKCVP